MVQLKNYLFLKKNRWALVVLQFADVKKDITISLAKVLSKDALLDVNRKLHLIVLKDLDLPQDPDLDHKIYQTG